MTQVDTQWPSGDGEMAGRIRDLDWAATPLGPIETWPASLKVVTRLLVNSRHPMFIWWGPEHIQIYDDAYRETMGPEKHPEALGGIGRETWAEIWDVIGPQIEQVMGGGPATWHENQLVPVTRHGGRKAVWWTYSFSPIEDEGSPTGIGGVMVICRDVTEQHLARIAVAESEERQAFLLKLSDALGPLVDARDIKATAAAVVSAWLDIASAGYAEVETGGLTSVITDEYNDGRIPSLTARYTLKDFSSVTEPMARGETIHFADLDDDGVSADTRAAFTIINVRAAVATPLIKHGVMVAYLFVAHPKPRVWTAADLQVLGEVAERTWAAVERARAESALRESEERFAQFADASSAGLWVRDAATLNMEYVSPAITRIYGIAPKAILGEVEKWAAMIVPDDRDLALEHLASARGGEAVAHEFRVQRPSDRAFRWIRNTDFPLRGNGHVQRIGGIAEDVTEAKLAAEHSAVLLAELQHRVRNIMAVIRAITARTGERAASVPEYAEAIAGRLLTLARVQTLLTRAANAGVGIAGIVRDELGAKAQHAGQYTIDGPDLVLSPKAAEVLTLAVHELTTNALKYGGLAGPDGHVTVAWATFERRGAPWLGFDWIETVAPERPPPDPSIPRQRGFGRELIEGRVPYELGGRGKVVIEPGGARCRLEFPLRDGESILATDGPQRAKVFGGSIDMTGEADLSGRRVLVIEDDYYLATDAARALQGAGAEVLGPCPTEEAARYELKEQRPDAAVVDINLGSGPSFKFAEALKDQGIPFVFTTGYDMEVIPAAFEGVERLQKPVQLRQIVDAVWKLLPNAA